MFAGRNRIKMFSILIFWILLIHPALGDVNELVQKAWRDNPSISSLESKAAAIEESLKQAVLWKDPLFTLEYSNVPVDSFDLGDHPMSGIQFGLSQAFPIPGKTKGRLKISKARHKSALYGIKEAKNRIRYLIKIAYWNLYKSRVLEKLTREHILRLDEMISSSRSRYEQGLTTQHALIKFYARRDQLEDSLNEFKIAQAGFLSILNTAIGQDVTTFIDTPDIISVANSPLTPEKFYQLAIENRPLLKMILSRQKERKLKSRQSSIEAWPNPTFKIGYRLREEVVGPMNNVIDEGTDFFSIGVAFPIPLFSVSNWNAEKGKSDFRSVAQRQDHFSKGDNIRGELERAVDSWRRNISRAKAYSESIVPKYKQAFAIALASFNVGQENYYGIYQAQVDLLDSQKILLDVRTTTHLNMAEVEMLVGDNLPDTGSLK